MTVSPNETPPKSEVYIGLNGGKYIYKTDPKTGELRKTYVSSLPRRVQNRILANLPPEVPTTFRVGKNSLDGKILEPMSHVDITLHLRHYPLDPFRPRIADPASNAKISNATSHSTFISDKLRSDFPASNTHLERIEVNDHGLLQTHHTSVDQHGNPTHSSHRSWPSHAKSGAESGGIAAAQKVFDDVINFVASTERQGSNMSQLGSDPSKTFINKEYAVDFVKTLGSGMVDGLTTGNAGGQVLKGVYKAGAALNDKKWGKAADETLSSGGTALATGYFRLPLTAESTLFAGKKTGSENAGFSQDRYGVSGGISVYVIPTIKAGANYYQELKVEGQDVRETFQTANVSGSVGESMDVAFGVGVAHTEKHQEYVVKNKSHTEQRVVEDSTGRQHLETVTSTSANIVVHESNTTDSAVLLVQGRISDRLGHTSAALGTFASSSDTTRTTEDGSALHVRTLESVDTAVVNGVQVTTEQTVLFATMKESHHETRSLLKSDNASTLASDGNYAFVRDGDIRSAPGAVGADRHITGTERYQEIGAFARIDDLHSGASLHPTSTGAYAYSGSASAHQDNATVHMAVHESGNTTRSFEGGGGGVRGGSDVQRQTVVLVETADTGHSLEQRHLRSDRDTVSATYSASVTLDVQNRRTEVDKTSNALDGRPGVATNKSTEASGNYAASAGFAAKDGSYRTQRTEEGTFNEQSSASHVSVGKLPSVLDSNMSGAGLLSHVNSLAGSAAPAPAATTNTEGRFKQSTHTQHTNATTGERMQRDETSRGTVKREIGPDGGLNKLDEKATYEYKEVRQKSYAEVLRNGARQTTNHRTEIAAKGTRDTTKAGRSAPSVTHEQQSAHVRDIIATDSRNTSMLGLCKNHTTTNLQVNKTVTHDRTLVAGAKTAVGIQNHLLATQAKRVTSMKSTETFLNSRLATITTDSNPIYTKRTENLQETAADGTVTNAPTDTKYAASVHTKAAGLSVGTDMLSNVFSSKDGQVSAEKVALNAGDAFATSLGREVLTEKITPVLQSVFDGAGAGFVGDSIVNAVSGALHGDKKQLEHLAFGVANKVVSEFAAEVLQSTLPVGYSHSKTVATKGFGKGEYESTVHRDNVDIPIMLGMKVGANFETSVTKYEKNGLKLTRRAKGLGVSGSVPAVSLGVGIYNVREKADTKVERIGDEIRTTDFERKLTGVVSARLKTGDREGFKDVFSLKSSSTKVVEMEKADGSAYNYREVAMKYLPATAPAPPTASTAPAAPSAPAAVPLTVPQTRAQQTSASMHKNLSQRVNNSIKVGAHEKVLKQRSVVQQKKTLGGTFGSSNKYQRFEKGERVEQNKSSSENVAVGDEVRSTFSSTSVTHEFMDLVGQTTKSRNWYGKKKYKEETFARGQRRQYEKEMERENTNVSVGRKADFSTYETGTSTRMGSAGETIKREENDYTQVDANSHFSYAQTGQSEFAATMHRHGTYIETTQSNTQTKAEVEGVSLVTHTTSTSAEQGAYVDLRMDTAETSLRHGRSASAAFRATRAFHHASKSLKSPVTSVQSTSNSYARGEMRQSSEKLQTDYARAETTFREDCKPIDPKPELKEDQTVAGVTGKADIDIYSHQKLLQGHEDHTTGSVQEAHVKSAVGRFGISQNESNIDHPGTVKMGEHEFSHSTRVDHEVLGVVSYTLEEGQSVIPGSDASLTAAATTTTYAALEKDLQLDGEFKGRITKDTYTPVKDVILRTDDTVAGRVVTERLVNLEDVHQQWSELPPRVEAAPDTPPSAQTAEGDATAPQEVKSRLEAAGLVPERNTRTMNILHVTDIETKAESATIGWGGITYESASDRELRWKQEKSDIAEGSGATAVLQNTSSTTGDVFDASTIDVNKKAGWVYSSTTTTVTPKNKNSATEGAESKEPSKPAVTTHVELSQGVSRGVSSAAGSAGNIVGKVLVNQAVAWCGGTVEKHEELSMEDVEQGAVSTVEGCIIGTCTEWVKAGSKMKSNGNVVMALASTAAVMTSAVLNHRKRRQREKKKKRAAAAAAAATGTAPAPAAPKAKKSMKQTILEGAQEVGSIALDILPSVVAVVGAATKYAAKASGISTKLSVAIEAVRSGYHYKSGTVDEDGNTIVDGMRLVENVGNAALGVVVSGAVFAAATPAAVATTTVLAAVVAAGTALVVPALLASLATYAVTAVTTRAMAWLRSWWTWRDMNKEYTALCVDLGFAEHTVTEVQINKAYRKMGLMYHPDSSQPTRNEAKFVELSTKYKRLLELYTQLNKGGSMSKLYSAIVNSMDMVKRKADMTFAQWDAWLESLVAEME